MSDLSRRATLVGGFGLGLASCSQAESDGGGVVGHMPDRGASISDTYDGFALSPDGSTLVGNLHKTNDDFHSLSFINLSNGSAWVLRPPKKVYLYSPAFSPDGAKLAFIATPSPYFGISQIIVTDIDGGNPQTFGNLGSFYCAPSFSRDMQRLACFRDTKPSRYPSWSLADLAKTQQFDAQLYEISLATHSERPLSAHAFEHGMRTAYDPLGRGVFFAAFHPVVPNRLFSSFRTAPDWVNAYDQKYSFTKNYLLPAHEDLAEAPVPYAPPSIAGTSKFLAVTDAGEVLLASSLEPKDLRPNAKHYSVARLYNGKDAVVIGDPSEGISDAQISADGKRAVLMKWPITANFGKEDPFTVKFIEVIDRPTNASTRIRLQDLKFTAAKEIEIDFGGWRP